MSPSMHGNIDISSGSLTLLATQTEYSDINARIELQGDNALVHRLVMKSGGGSAEVTGKIALKDFTPVDAELALKCRGFKVMSTNIFTGSIDSDIKIKGLSASGKVTVTQGIVNIPSQSKAEANEIEYVKTGPGGRNIPVPAAVTPDIYKMLVLDVRLLAPEKTWVYGQGISAEIRADLNVTKQRDEPLSYDGAIEVIRGTYKISERTLTISEGKLVTRGSNIMDSLISAKASCKLTDVSIDVLVGGTLNKLMINFQSDPPMERADIISYLAFGAPSSKLSMSQSSAVKGSSYGILAGFAEKDIKSAVNRVVPIDELTIQPSEGSWGVGKNITDKLTAKYEWRSAEDERPQTVLDYRLDRHFSLDSLMGDPLTSGVDLFWKLGY
jgi:translocation and assembly module TamB